jgi:hypothetical protein
MFGNACASATLKSRCAVVSALVGMSVAGVAGVTSASAAPAGVVHVAAKKVVTHETLKAAASTNRAKARIYFNATSSFTVGKKSVWSVDFGDHYKLVGTGKAPKKVWHIFAKAQTFPTSFGVLDAKSKTHFAKSKIKISSAVAGSTGVAGSSGVVGGSGRVVLLLNGKVVRQVVTSNGAASVEVTSALLTSVGSSTTSTTVNSSTTSTTSTGSNGGTGGGGTGGGGGGTTPSDPTSPAHSIAPTASLGLGLNLFGLLNGTLLNFNSSATAGSSAITSWAVNWGDGSFTRGTGMPTASLTHAFSGLLGSHTATLTVTAADGDTASSAITFLTIL